MEIKDATLEFVFGQMQERVRWISTAHVSYTGRLGRFLERADKEPAGPAVMYDLAGLQQEALGLQDQYAAYLQSRECQGIIEQLTKGNK
jgi:hypothetical protein